MNETRALVRFVAQTRFEDLPRSLVDSCKLTLLDTLAAAFVGARQPWARRILAVAHALGGSPEASVIHQDWRADVSRAAFANGVLIGAFECEPLTGSHACGTVLPAALAVCQRERFDELEARCRTGAYTFIEAMWRNQCCNSKSPSCQVRLNQDPNGP